MRNRQFLHYALFPIFFLGLAVACLAVYIAHGKRGLKRFMNSVEYAVEFVYV